MALFQRVFRSTGVGAGQMLLPADGAPAAERRTHPRHREAFGEAVPTRLEELPDEVARTVEDACDANLGLAGSHS